MSNAQRVTEMTIQTAPAVNILKEELPDLGANSVVLNLKINSLGRKKKVKVSDSSLLQDGAKGSVYTDADPDLISAGKELLESLEVKQIAKCDNALRNTIKILALPANKALRSGFLRIPVTLLGEVEGLLKRYITKREELIEQLINNRDLIIEQDKQRLRSLFDLNDYPTSSELKSAYQVSYQYMAFVVPEVLMEAGIYEQEREKAQEQLRIAVEECQVALRSELAEMVRHATEKLTVKDGEEPKIFRNSLIDKVENFITFFSARNITNDTELAAVVDEVKGLVKNIPDAEKLRTDSDLRKQIAQEFSSINKTIEQNIIARPKRKMKLADE